MDMMFCPNRVIDPKPYHMINVAVIQYKPLFGNVDGNIKRLRHEFGAAWRHHLVVLPELASTGYRFSTPDEALLCSETIQGSRYLSFLADMAIKNGCYIVSGFNERDGEHLYNSSVLIGPEGLVGVYRKLHLFNDEKLYFEPGNLGVNVFETSIGRIGMLVCFDWMFPEVWRIMAIKGAQIVAHPSNLVLPYCQDVVPSHALVNRYYVVTANRIGQERDLRFTGKSVLVNPFGDVLVSGEIDKEQVLSADIDVSVADNKQVTAGNHLINDRRVDVYGNYKIC
jgi:predicted amidohydrolase